MTEESKGVTDFGHLFGMRETGADTLVRGR